MSIIHTRQYLAFLLVIIFCILSCTTVQGGASMKEQTIKPQAAVKEAQSTQTGTPEAADQRAVVNLKDIATQETLSPPAPKAPKVIHRPLPGPER
jgi:hypothetical protein